MDVEHYRQQLVAERNRLLKTLEGLHQGGMRQPLRESLQELSLADNHPGDVGTETFEREKDAGLADQTRLLLDRVDEALSKIHEGSYGICSRCKAPIAQERLDAIPYATLCLSCQNRLEKEEHRDIDPSVSRERGSLKRETDTIGYDSEDAWQDAARHGTSSTPSDFPGTRRVEDAFVDSAEPRGTVEDVEGLIYEKGEPEHAKKPEEEAGEG